MRHANKAPNSSSRFDHKARPPSTSKHALLSSKASWARNTDDGALMMQKEQYGRDKINKLVSNILMVPIKPEMSVWVVELSKLRN